MIYFRTHQRSNQNRIPWKRLAHVIQCCVPSPLSELVRCISPTTHTPVEDPGQDVCVCVLVEDSLSTLPFPYGWKEAAGTGVAGGAAALKGCDG